MSCDRRTKLSLYKLNERKRLHKDSLAKKEILMNLSSDSDDSTASCKG